MKPTNERPISKAAILYRARQRAKDSNIEFNIDIDDIIVPERCPVLGIPFKVGQGKGGKESSPSLDRINPYLGYIKGNVRVISWRANKVKSSATVEELELIARYMRGAFADDDG